MATQSGSDGPSSLLTQKRQQMQALAIETRDKFAALNQGIQQDIISETQKKVDSHLSALDKQINSFIESMKKRLERELAQQVSSSITSGLGIGGSSQSKGQALSQLSSLLSSAWRNL